MGHKTRNTLPPRLEVADDDAEGGGDAAQDDQPQPSGSPLLGIGEVDRGSPPAATPAAQQELASMQEQGRQTQTKKLRLQHQQTPLPPPAAPTTSNRSDAEMESRCARSQTSKMKTPRRPRIS